MIVVRHQARRYASGPFLDRKLILMGTSERLAALSGEIAAIRTEIGILQEQLTYAQEVADDARLRAMVSETPLADRDEQDARADAERTKRSLDDATARLQKLLTEQDGLLERLFGETRSG